MNTLSETTLVFLGGAKRVTLAEQFVQILGVNGVRARVVSIERDNGFYPMAMMGEIVAGPDFASKEFATFLSLLMHSCVNPIVLASIDAAVTTLADFAGCFTGLSRIVAHTRQGAEIAFNKRHTALFCKEQEIAHPHLFTQGELPTGKAIAKPVSGSGSKNLRVFEQGEPVDAALFQTHVVQEFVDGQETTHDLYIDRDGHCIVFSRDRLAVTGGEVVHCRVRTPTEAELTIMKKIAASGYFWGPVTVQTIDAANGPILLEINARFGGGVTASIAAGFPGLELLAWESLGLPVRARETRLLEMKRAFRDFYRFV